MTVRFPILRKTSSGAMNVLQLAVVLMSFQIIYIASAHAQSCVDNPSPYVQIDGLPSVGFPICYEPPVDSKYKQAFDDLQRRHILERYAQFLSPLRLPHKLTLKALQCAPIDSYPFYSPQDRTLHFCYEFYQTLLNIAPAAITPEGVTRDDVISGTWAGVLLHETAHALFDMLDVPVFGREEDAADQIAAFIPLQFSVDVERSVIKGYAYFWQLAARQLHGDPPLSRIDPKDPSYPKTIDDRCKVDPFCRYSDLHGTSSQRLYNTLCLGYGADQKAFQDLVQLGWLPEERASHCGEEFERLRSAFVQTILPFVDEDKLKRVKTIQWLKPDELK